MKHTTTAAEAFLLKMLATIPSAYNMQRKVVSWVQQIKYNKDSARASITLYTQQHEYTITCKGIEDSEESYLGCGASNRYHDVGEDWHEGRDLPDGIMSEGKWNEILLAILSYELIQPKMDVRVPIANEVPLKDVMSIERDSTTTPLLLQ